VVVVVVVLLGVAAVLAVVLRRVGYPCVTPDNWQPKH